MSVTAEIVRHVVIFLFTVTLGTVGGVMRLHYRAWRLAPSGSGMLPLHVFLISAAQMSLLTGAAIGILDTLESPLSYKMYFYVLGCLLTLFALCVIGRLQHRRIINGGQSSRSVDREAD